MNANASFLSNPKYGYDFVVSTTQASINSGLRAYLSKDNQPVTYICFLADPDTGNPTKQIALADLLKLTGGVNPFDIPNGTPYKDPRIGALTGALFVAGVKIKMGLPPGVLPKDLPLIATLGNSANNVLFNMFCSQFEVIQNSPPTGFGGTGKWNVWSQKYGTPWYVQTRVNLVTKDLDKELNTPYFNNNPELKATLKRQLVNLSSSAFSLQQLLFDLDNAVMQTVPTFQGLPQGSNAEAILQKSFVSIYSKSAKEYGLPLVSVTAVSQTPDQSPLRLTGYERQVSPLKDERGVLIENPTKAQISATTLDYLCATNDRPLPGASSFNWNWVLPQDIDVQSGVIAINRNTIGKYILDQLLPQVKSSCIASTCHVVAEWWGKVTYSWTLGTGQTPQTAIITPSGSDVIRISYTSSSTATDKAGATAGELQIAPSYTCDVNFTGNTMTVKQRLTVYVYARWDETGEGINAFDKTITDKYTISVDQYGGLRTTKTASVALDDSQSPDQSGIANFFTGINDLVNAIKGKVTSFATTTLKEIPFTRLQNFVFPGARVFTYKSASFSNNQDLICAITYVDPSEVPSAPVRLLAEKTSTAMPSLRASAAKPALNLTHSSDLMQNYLQGEIVSPTGKFEALQTDDGHALLFAIDSSNVFHVIEEQSGTTRTGWELRDLSTAAIQANFPGKMDAVVRTFDAGQSAFDGTIGLAMAVSSGGSDHLFVSLYNYSADTSWTTKPNWTSYPFDAVAERPASISIAGILFAETLGSQQYLVVDIDRSPKSSVKDIVRYYIDPSKTSGSHWVKHDVPVDIEDGSYQSCVGRVKNGFVDGVYTSGMTAGAAQLVYVPVINVFGEGPPLPTRLRLPGRAVPSAIAATRNRDESSNLYGTTDLYAISGSTLYRFAADAQVGGGVGKPLVTNAFLAGTEKLLTMTLDGVTTLWGKSGSDEIYYLSCPVTQLAVPGSWSTPVPILSGVERISAYSNKADGGNTIFASGGGKLQKLIQATNTTAKVWRAQEIKLAVPAQQKSLSFSSYTTTIHVADADDLPAREVELQISAESRTPVYINGLYYVLGQTPVMAKTDAMGAVTVIEATEDINGTVIKVSSDGGLTSTVINPMDKSFQKVAALNSENSLRSAAFPTETKSGGIVGQKKSIPLVAPRTPKGDVKVVADNLAKLNTVYSNVRNTTPLAALQDRGVVPATLFLASSSSLGVDIAIAAGDLFRWLKSGVNAVINIVKDAVSDAWHFFATIAGKVYRATLNAVDAIIGAVEWAFDAIKTAVEDLVHFLEFLFEWDDIRRTKDVIHNLTKLYLQDKVDDIKGARIAFDEQVEAAEQRLKQWTGINDWSQLGAPASKPVVGSASNPAKGQTSSSQLFAGHFRNHASELTVLSGEPTFDVVQNLADDLLTAISNEGTVLSAVYSQLHELASKFHSMSVGDAIKGIAGILVNGVLSSVQVVVDALLDVLYQLASSAIGLLDAKIHVPIISDILNGIGIPDISFLDLFTWIAAVGYTVVYKIANDKAPFPNDDNVGAIIGAKSWDSLVALFPQKRALFNSDTSSLLSTDSDSLRTASSRTVTVSLPESLQEVIFVTGHAVAGFLSFTGDFINFFEAESETGENPFSTPSAVIGVISAISAGAADALVPQFAVENTTFSILSKATTAAVLVSKLVLSGPAQKFAAKSSKFSGLAVSDGRATGAIINALLVIPALYVTGWHFYELSGKPVGAERSAAIVGEVSNLASYISRVSYAVAVNDEDPESRQVAVGIMAVSNLAVAGLQTAEAIIH